MEVDFTDQIIELKKQAPCANCACNPCICGTRGWKARADEKAGYPPNCNEGYEEKGGKCVVIEGYWKKKTVAEKNYPGKGVSRRKDGVPKKKMKKRACKKGEYRDKNGNLKKTKGESGEIVVSQPETKELQNPRNMHEYDKKGKPEDLPQPKTKGLENPRNMHEYYKNLYKKVKGLN